MAWLIIGFAVVVALFLLFFFMASSSNSQPYENIAEVIDWDAIADEELQSYLPNQKINAIKRYRELTNVGLKEAKDAVEFAMVNPEARKKTRKVGKSVDTDGAGIRDLIAAGQIEEAIDVYASFMGIDEFSARDAVQDMEREMTLEDASYGTDSSDNFYESSSSNDYFDSSSDNSSFDSFSD